MDILSLGRALGLGAGLEAGPGLAEKGLIAVYGAGGKTTILERLAGEICRAGKKVILTTTTRMLRPAGMPVVVGGSLESAAGGLRRELREHDLVALCSAVTPGAGGKMAGVEVSWVEEIWQSGLAQFVLVEADGAAGRPIKGYAPYEPVLPPGATLVIPVLGLDGIGSAASPEAVHRCQQFCDLTGVERGRPVNVRHFAGCLLFMLECGGRQSPHARIIPVINKCDLLADLKLARAVADAAATFRRAERILFCAAREEEPARIGLELSAGRARPFASGVILAAGQSSRMGREKLSLPLGEKTILEHSVGSALQGGLDEVIVVTRPEESGRVQRTFSGTAVKTVVNPFYRRGIASSLQAGLGAVSWRSQGAVIALGDQPFVTADVYELLLKSYSRCLSLITYPLYKGKRGHPVLFDRRTWGMLMRLQGDSGGKELLSTIPAARQCAVEAPHPGILVDIDTPQQYRDLAGWDKKPPPGEEGKEVEEGKAVEEGKEV